MPIKQICLDYGRDADLVSYALALAHALGAELYIQYAPPEGVVLDEATADETQMRMLEHVISYVPPRGTTPHLVAQCESPLEWPNADAVLVSNTLEDDATLPVWRPAYEMTLRTITGPVFVPFGNKPGLEHGYRYGIDLAYALRRPVVLYHSTWRKDGVLSADGQDHWHEGAEQVARDAEAYATERGVTCTLVVECAESVVEGTHRAALKAGACCIVLQRDAHVIAGGYDEQLRARSLVPTLTLP